MSQVALAAAGNVGRLQQVCRSAHVAPLLLPPAPVVMPEPPAPLVVPAPPAPVVAPPHSIRHLLLTQLPREPRHIWQASVNFEAQPCRQVASLQGQALTQVVYGPQSPPEALPLCHPGP